MQESVRVYSVDVAITLAERLTEAEVEDFIFNSIEGWAGMCLKVLKK